MYSGSRANPPAITTARTRPPSTRLRPMRWFERPERLRRARDAVIEVHADEAHRHDVEPDVQRVLVDLGHQPIEVAVPGGRIHVPRAELERAHVDDHEEQDEQARRAPSSSTTTSCGWCGRPTSFPGSAAGRAAALRR